MACSKTPSAPVPRPPKSCALFPNYNMARAGLVAPPVEKALSGITLLVGVNFMVETGWEGLLGHTKPQGPDNHA